MANVNLVKAWRQLKLSKRRHQQQVPWLSWGTEDAEDQGEPSTLALESSCSVIRAMFLEYGNLDIVPIKPLLKTAPCLSCILSVMYRYDNYNAFTLCLVLV